MSLRYALLGLLADRPYNGWQLLKQFEGSLAYAWPALHSQIYPELARLRESGLIEQTGEGPRRAKVYSLTATGRDEIERWLRETTPSRTTRDEALLRVFFLWLLEPDEAAAYLDREVEFQRRLLADLERIASTPVSDNATDRSVPARARLRVARHAHAARLGRGRRAGAASALRQAAAAQPTRLGASACLGCAAWPAAATPRTRNAERALLRERRHVRLDDLHRLRELRGRMELDDLGTRRRAAACAPAERNTRRRPRTSPRARP